MDAPPSKYAARWHVAWILGPCLLLAACASLHGPQVPDGLRAEEVVGEPFRHQLLVNGAYAELHSSSTVAPPLHVYVDGDGAPWSSSGVRVDPSPRAQLVRRMVQQDRAPALYLGRPCHFTSSDPACTPESYTFGRYSPAVVASMAKALGHRLPAASRVVLIGYSGGGALAMLIAAHWRSEPVLAQHALVGVVTLAANLDIAAWTALHGYTPLYASLDPALQPALPAAVRQLHLAGARDLTVPADIVRQGLRQQLNAELRVLDGVDHSCCWLREWPAVLRELRTWER